MSKRIVSSETRAKLKESLKAHWAAKRGNVVSIDGNIEHLITQVADKEKELGEMKTKLEDRLKTLGLTRTTEEAKAA